MIEEHLEVGGPPRRTGGRSARLRRRAAGALAGVVLLAAGGWAVAHGALDDPPATPRRPPATPTPTPEPSRRGSDEELAGRTAPPARIPYLQYGVLHAPHGGQRALPDGPWRDFALLDDGRVVLVRDGSVTVVGTGVRGATYPMSGGLARRRDGAAVAWTGPDGTVRMLRAGRPQPVAVRGSRLLAPACRGWQVSAEPRGPWRSCDDEGGPLSPDGRYVVEAHPRRFTVGLRHRPPSVDAQIGRVVDVAWESDRAVLVVTQDESGTYLLSRVDATTGVLDDLQAADAGKDPSRPVLVLP